MDEFNLIKLPDKILSDIYQDTFSPGAKELGISLKQLTSVLKLITLPMGMVGISCDVLLKKYQDFLISSFKKVPEDKLISPDLTIATPLLQNVQNVFDKESLCNLYSNLLATAANKEKYQFGHPSFVNIIAQLDKIDVLILEKFKEDARIPYMKIDLYLVESKRPAHLMFPYTYLEDYKDQYEPISSSLQNLERLGLIYGDDPIIPIKFNNIFDEIYNAPAVSHFIEITNSLKNDDKKMHPFIDRGCYKLTELGKRFFSACKK